MELFFLVLTSGVSCLAGAFVAWALQDKKNRDAREALEYEMRSEVEARYRAYVDLEHRVGRMIQGFGQREAELERRLTNQKRSIHDLQEAVSRHTGYEEFEEKAKDTDFLGLPLEADPTARPVSATSASVGDALAQMDLWEQRVEDSQVQHEIDRQSTQIAAVTEHVRRLEPLSETVFKRESEIEDWKRKYGALEEALTRQARALDVCIQDLRPAADRLSESEESVRTLHTRFEDELADKQAELTTARARIESLEADMDAKHSEIEAHVERAARLEGRVGELEALEGEVRGLRETVGRLEAELDEKRRTIDAIEERYEQRMLELREQADQRQATYEERCETYEGRCEMYETRCEDYERRLVEETSARMTTERQSAEEIERFEREADEYEVRFQEYERELTLARAEAEDVETKTREATEELREELAVTKGELEHLTAEHQEAGRRLEFHAEALKQKDADLAQKDERITELTEEVDTLADGLSRTSQSLDGQQSQISALMSQLDDANAAAATRGSTLEEAQGVLEALRPMLKTLETKLGK